jgi:hypothetical protein
MTRRVAMRRTAELRDLAAGQGELEPEGYVDARIGLRVRSKRRNGPGTIVGHGGEPYPWLVAWDDGASEWCREGELRAIEPEPEGQR